MSKKRLDYTYVAGHLDTSNRQNLGDYSIGRKASPHPMSDPRYRSMQAYHYDSNTGRLVNRTTLRSIARGSRIYRDCLAAIERLFSEDVEAWMFTENMKKLTEGDTYP